MPRPDRSAGTVTTYLGFNYLQNLNPAAAYTATYTDNGVGVAGTLSFGTPAVSVTMTPNANANGDGGIAYGSPVTAGVAIASNSKDSNLPAVAMICQNISGSSSTKSTDVLVTSTATQITSASGLANQTFTFFREDCSQGGTNPPTTSGNALVFDANGNVTVTGTATISSPTISASTFTLALNGQAIYDATAGKYTVFNAFSFVKPNGSTGYAVIEHDAPALSGMTKGVISVWSQQ